MSSTQGQLHEYRGAGGTLVDIHAPHFAEPASGTITSVMLPDAESTPTEWTAINASDKLDAVSLLEDATKYLEDDSYAGTPILEEFTLGNPVPAIPAGAAIQGVDVVVRMQRVNSGSGNFAIALRLSGNNTTEEWSSYDSWTDHTESDWSRPGGGDWAIADLTGLSIRLRNISDEGARVRYPLAVLVRWIVPATVDELMTWAPPTNQPYLEVEWPPELYSKSTYGAALFDGMQFLLPVITWGLPQMQPQFEVERGYIDQIYETPDLSSVPTPGVAPEMSWFQPLSQPVIETIFMTGFSEYPPQDSYPAAPPPMVEQGISCTMTPVEGVSISNPGCST